MIHTEKLARIKMKWFTKLVKKLHSIKWDNQSLINVTLNVGMYMYMQHVHLYMYTFICTSTLIRLKMIFPGTIINSFNKAFIM